MKTTQSKILLGVVMCLILGLSVSITLGLNKNTKVYAYDGNIYNMVTESIQASNSLMYGDYYNGEMLQTQYATVDTYPTLTINNKYYLLYHLNSFYSYNGVTYEKYFPRSIIQNSYTLFFSTPLFYDGYSNIEDEEQNQYSINYVDPETYIYISLLSSDYNYISHSPNNPNNQGFFDQLQSMIDDDLLTKLRVESGDYVGEMGNFYFTSDKTLDEVFYLNYSQQYWYLLIECSQGYSEMLYSIPDDIFGFDLQYNYPSIYISKIRSTIIENQTVIGYSEEQLQEAINKEIQDYIQNDGYQVYLDGIDLGRQQGYAEGYQDGKRDGLVEAPNAFREYTNVLTTAWDGARQFLTTPILGNLTILHIVLIPLLLGIFLIILKLIRG